MMRSVSGEFEVSPWGTVGDWGRCVKVDSVDDINTVQRLVAVAGVDRCAVIFEWQTSTRRQTLLDALEAGGLALRPFDDTDHAVSSWRPTGIEWLLMLPGLPYVLIMRLRRRTTRMYEVTKTP